MNRPQDKKKQHGAGMRVNTFALQVFADADGGFIRVFGRGFGWKDLRKRPLMFSERNGYKKHIEIGNWSFAWI